MLKNRGLYKTVKFKNPTYVGDPTIAVRIFNEKEVDELIILDIHATRENRGPNFKIIHELASECFMPLGYGGGITSLDEIKQLFNLGVEKVCLNTIAAKNPKVINEAAKIFGSQSIVGAIDVKKSLFGKHQVAIRCGDEIIKTDPITHAKQLEDCGVGEIFLNSIDLEGTMNGYDLDLIKIVSQAVKVPVIASGGAGNQSDLRKSLDAGASAASAGSMFVFHGKHKAVLITYPAQNEIYDIIQ